MALPPAIIAAIISAGAGAVSKTAGIAQQNAYNHPAKQLARLRKAGLPYAAYSEGGAAGAGNQSGMFDGKEFDNAAGYLSQILTNQKDQEAINMVKLEQDMQRMKNRVYGGEVNFLLDMKGPDGKTPNQITNLKAMQGISLANQKGLEIGNIIRDYERENTPFRINAENAMIESQIENIKSISRANNANADIAEIEAAFRERKSVAELESILLRNGLTKEQIESLRLSQNMQRIENEVAEYTKNNRMTQSDYDVLIKGIQSKEVARLFKNNSDYQLFTDKVREYLQNEKPTLRERADAYIALLYQSIVGVSGNAPGFGNILQSLGGGNSYNNTYYNSYLKSND